MALLPKCLQLMLPGALTRYLPVLLYATVIQYQTLPVYLSSSPHPTLSMRLPTYARFGQHLEDAALDGLVPVVAAIVGILLASDLLVLRSQEQPLPTQVAQGILGLALGSAVFHVVVVLFGAPVVDLWMQTLLLAVLLASCVTMPLALHLGPAPRKWLDLLLELSVSNTQELYLVCSSIGAMLGAYVGALPIPLDWDRPWQQWPLTCVYGTLLGHAAGILVSIVIGATSTSFAAKSTKKD
ncbi:hypothetical protein PHYPSEUDO_001972 [Phytophthora pseudosyringae]|uniref:Phosphatidylinositol-glycan biosynthesis class F protein n=1 Tax=Phytophthora pseudosyringae TaxID=221518 RepID=A0A8T1VVS6_9STRA|nr:hypothetical protein PHYPSEUDO_001972 [Phytophthora pseudosyringae]